MLPLVAALTLSVALPPAQEAAVAEVRAAGRGPGRALVAAVADGRVRAEDLWAADAALHAAGEPSVLGPLLEVVFRRAAGGDCTAALALEALARSAPHPQAGVLAKRLGKLLLARPDAVRGCWPVYERLLPVAGLEKTAACDERDRALALYGRCTCTSAACREMVRMLGALACPRTPPADPLALPGCS